MAQAMAFSILALTVGLSLSRPRIGWLRIQHSLAAVIGALLTVASGLVSPAEAVRALSLLAFPLVTIVGLMVITLIAERAGLFDVLARRLAIDANGNGRRLFTYLFLGGTVIGTVFTNDAAVLIFTPLVFHVAAEARDASWKEDSATPYYFAVLYVGNLVGGLVISNPINIIVSSLFGIRFLEYARWMALPAIASIVVSYLGLRYFFRKAIPRTYRIPLPFPLPPGRRKFVWVCTMALALTLVGFFSEPWTGVPPWLVALVGASLLLGLHATMIGEGIGPILRGVGWDVIVFVLGIFVVAAGLRSAGLTGQIARLVTSLAQDSLPRLTFATGFVAAVSSAILNNHPTAGLMAHVLQGLGRPPFETKMAVFAALVGGDVGPKMLPIGSLAALIWFRILRNKGVKIPYGLYVRIGVPVTLLAVLISVAILNLEASLAR